MSKKQAPKIAYFQVFESSYSGKVTYYFKPNCANARLLMEMLKPLKKDGTPKVSLNRTDIQTMLISAANDGIDLKVVINKIQELEHPSDRIGVGYEFKSPGASGKVDFGGLA